MEGTVKRLVDDPMITPAELEARRRRLLERGERKEAGLVGKIEADVKLTTLIGGLARISNRTEPQVLAAARYRGLFERIQIGGAKAVDYTAVRVDTSAGPVDMIFEIGENARREYRQAVQRLGLAHSAIVEQVVCHDMSMRELARRLEDSEGGAARERIEQRVLAGVDVLVDLFGYGKAEGKGSAGYRFLGELPREIDQALITTRALKRSA